MNKILIKLLSIFLIVQGLESDEINPEVNSIDNISESDLSFKLADNIFETPDISIDYKTDNGLIHLDAYRTTNNDKIIASKDPSQYGNLKWVSIGSPQLTEMPSQTNPNLVSLFHFSTTHFSTYFEMLTQRDKDVLRHEVMRTRNISISNESFINLKPNDLNCVTYFMNSDDKLVVLKGKVYDFQKSPYQIRFNYLKNNLDRKAFEKFVSNHLKEDELHIDCKLTSGSQIKKTNTFTLTVQEINNLNLVDKLFGDSNENYLTRDQLTELSYEINNNFQVVEDYQMSEEQFSTTFVESLIALSSDSAFKSIPFDKALENLSKYSTDFSGDLVADQISKDLSNVFKIEQSNNKSHIVFDKTYHDELMKQTDKNSKIGGSASVFGIGGGSASKEYAESKKDVWINKGTSLDDQLNELNTLSGSSIQYEINGNKIIPKSLRVSKIQSSTFKKSLTFTRIKNFYFEADLIKDFTLSSRMSLLTPTFVSDMATQLNELNALKSTSEQLKTDLLSAKTDIKSLINKNEGKTFV